MNPKDCLLRVWGQIIELSFSMESVWGFVTMDFLMGMKPHKLPSNYRGQNNRKRIESYIQCWHCILEYMSLTMICVNWRWQNSVFYEFCSHKVTPRHTLCGSRSETIQKNEFYVLHSCLHVSWRTEIPIHMTHNSQSSQCLQRSTINEAFALHFMHNFWMTMYVMDRAGDGD